MEKRCFKTVGDKGRVYLPAFIREAAGIGRYDVVQITGRGGVILLNKAAVNADDPVELIQKEVMLEQEAMEKEKSELKNRMQQLLAEGNSLDDVLEEALKFIF